MKLRFALQACALAAVALVATTATAGAAVTTCTGNGVIAPGTYDQVVVASGSNCTFGAGTITINGNLIVQDGAILNDHALSSAVVHINGNVIVGRGAVIGLGTYVPNSGTVVNGNIVANQPGTLYLGGITVNGNVVSNGGGDPTRNFPIKDDVIRGNLIIQGWSGLWMGAIRDTVGGNVIVQNNAASNPNADPGTDSTEVANNDIGGNLICQNNVPAAQLGDTSQPGSRVSGHKIGECASF
jgi:hypothetical protein